MWIYVIYNSINGKLYVGQTERSDPSERWKEHVECAQGIRRQRLYTAMRHYGIEKFEFIPLEEHASIQELDNAEKFWIYFLRSWDEPFGYNKTMGGQWGRLTPDKIKHLSEINSGEKNPFYGKHHSDSAKKAIGTALKGNKHGLGRIHTLEQKEKQRQSMQTVWANQEYKERLRKKQLSVQRFVLRSKLTFLDVEIVKRRLLSGELAKDIAKSLNVSPAMITRIKQGKYTPCTSNVS